MASPRMKTTRLLHGADYNYEQWLNYPEIHDADFAYMQKTKCNVMSVGIFSWVMLEPEEGRYEFGWMDRLLDRLHESGVYAILATPSGSKPAWLSHTHPEVCQVDRNGIREPHGARHNHCRTSPVYREKCVAINTRLAERYKDHPALLMWHVSNEYGATECYCDYCLDAFRQWLNARYGSLDALNHAWWTSFWSHRFTAWDQIRPGDQSIHGLQLDWRRFISHQTLDFFLAESQPLREITPEIPITTNFMRPNVGLNYWDFAPHVDIIAWDSYPRWHFPEEEWREGLITGFFHDVHRSYKNAPFLLMESTPSVTNWQGTSIPKKPGMHLLSSLQAVAHGSNSAQYFQWRQGRGGSEKFHGAVMNHLGTDDTQVFADVTSVGESLEKLEPIGSAVVEARVAIVYDQENEWAIRQAEMPGSDLLHYVDRCIAHYSAFWRMGIACDVIDSVGVIDLERYSLIVAPMLYMVRPGVADRLISYVEGGGTLVLTYLTGLVDESDLCFLGGFPGPLRDLAGVTVEDTDIVVGQHTQSVAMVDGAALDGSSDRYTVTDFADRLRVCDATVLGRFTEGFMDGLPAVTMKESGKGRTYYLASRNDDRFLLDFYRTLTSRAGLESVIDGPLPIGVNCQTRRDGERLYCFIMNFNKESAEVSIGSRQGVDLLTDEPAHGMVTVDGYGIRVIEVRKGEDTSASDPG